MDALPKHPRVRELLDMYAELFHIEAECTNRKQNVVERLEVRKRCSEPLLARMRAWIEGIQKTVLPKDILGEAVTYVLGQWEPLSAFLKDGRIPLDNNISERALRPVVLGRNNFLFFGSEDGAVGGALFYSLVQPNSRILELTPAGWHAARNSASVS